MDIRQAIRSKRAVRQFTDKPVPHEDILTILDAGRRSQSSKNSQPWQFIVVKEKATLKALSQTGTYAEHQAGAAFVVALVGMTDEGSISFDLGQAAAYMQLAAWELGIGSCLATMHQADKAKAVLGIPPEQYFRMALSFGYPAPEFVPAKRGGRKPIEAIVHWEKW